MRCPICGTALGSGMHEGVAIHGCATCGGRFLTFDALRTVLTSEAQPRTGAEREAAMASAGTAASVAPDARPPLACPACNTQMRRYVHQYASGVWLDACDEHGVWLDAGELEQLEAYAEATARGATQAPSSHVSPRRPPIADQEPWDDNPQFDLRPEKVARRFAGSLAKDALLNTIGFGLVGDVAIPSLDIGVGRGVAAWKDMNKSDQRAERLLEETRQQQGLDPKRDDTTR